MPDARTLLDFGAHGAVERWTPIDDVVMGGVSRSRFERTPHGAAFTGVVSLENGGGFASVRCAPARWNADGAIAFVLDVRGDGKRYKLTTRTDDGFDGVQYQCPFDTRAFDGAAGTGEWQRIELPAADFVASFRGRRVAGAPPLAPERIRQFGLMISEKQAGPFRLEIARLAVR